MKWARHRKEIPYAFTYIWNKKTKQTKQNKSRSKKQRPKERSPEGVCWGNTVNNVAIRFHGDQ